MPDQAVFGPMPTDQTKYRINFTIQRMQPGETDYTEIGFSGTGDCSSPAEASFEVSSMIENGIWETGPGQPEPSEVMADASS